MSGATIRRFASTPIGMHSQLYDNATSKPLGVVLEPDGLSIPAGTYLARPCPAGVLIDDAPGVPALIKDCTEPHSRKDILVGAQIGQDGDRRSSRVISGRADAFDAFIAAHAGQPFVLTIIDPTEDD